MRTGSLLLVILTSVIALAAPLDELKADRPGLTDPPDLIGRGVLQLESGFALQQDQDGGPRTLAVPTPSLRFGLSERFELRLSADGYVRKTPRTGDNREATAGPSDAVVSVKVKLRSETNRLPALTVIPALSAPTGLHAFSSRAYDPGIKLTASKELGWKVGVGGNAGVSSASDDGRRHRQTMLGVSAGRELRFGVSGFGELYYATTTDDPRPTRIVDGGLAAPVGKNAQVDISFGRAVTENGPDWFLSAGLVLRYPKKLFPK